MDALLAAGPTRSADSDPPPTRSAPVRRFTHEVSDADRPIGRSTEAGPRVDPPHPAPRDAPPESGSKADPLATVSVLIIDADPLASELLVGTLTGLGYDVQRAATGLEAVGQAATLATQGRPLRWVFLSDTLTDMDPLDTFHRVRRQCPDVRGLLLTGAADVHLVFDAIAAGVRHVLPRPLDPCVLMDLLADSD